MRPLLTYSPSDVQLQLCGYAIGGVVSISVRWNDPAFKIVRGIRGKNTRVYNHNKSCTISVELLQTSVSNFIFSDLVTNDVLQSNVRLDVSLRDLSGKTKLMSNKAFIAGYPDFTFSDGLENRTWTIECMDYFFMGLEGNPKQIPDLFGAASDGIDTVKGWLGI